MIKVQIIIFKKRLHKNRNLIKPFVLCATKGKIVDIYGPFAAVDSDSTFINSLISEIEELKEFFKESDLILLDRGFKFSVKFLKSLKLNVKLPTCEFLKIFFFYFVS